MTITTDLDDDLDAFDFPYSDTPDPFEPVDEVALERVIRGLDTLDTLPRQHWADAVAELRNRGTSMREAARVLGRPGTTVCRWWRELDAGRTPAALERREPRALTTNERRAVLDCARGRRPLSSVPRLHRWIVVQTCRAEGLGIEATARRVQAYHGTVRAHLADPGPGARL